MNGNLAFLSNENKRPVDVVLEGDALAVLKTLADESVHCVYMVLASFGCQRGRFGRLGEQVAQRYTAWELCGDWWWVKQYDARIVGGRSQYETATASTTQQTVALRRAVALHRITRYVHPDTLMELVPKNDYC